MIEVIAATISFSLICFIDYFSFAIIDIADITLLSLRFSPHYWLIIATPLRFTPLAAFIDFITLMPAFHYAAYHCQSCRSRFSPPMTLLLRH